MEFAGNCAVLAYRLAAWLKVTGEDAGSYLQGQFSQDLRGLAVGASTYGLLLNHKGRIQADGFIVKAADAFWIASYECNGDRLRERLESFIVADDVIVEDQTGSWSGLAILELPHELPPSGPTSSDGLGSGSLQGFRANPNASQSDLSLADRAAAQKKNLFWFRGRRGLGNSWEYIFPQAMPEVERDLPQVLSEVEGRARLTGARADPPEFWERARITACIPSVPRDAGPGDLPQEVGLVAPAVSFTKGCYLGQEIMARLKTRGRIRRQLRQVRFQEAVGPSAPGGRAPPLFAGARLVGELRSWTTDGHSQAGFIGLAMTPADAPLGSKYSFSPDAEPLIELTAL